MMLSGSWGKKGSPKFLTEDVIFVLLGFLAVVIVVIFAVNQLNDSDVEKLEKCRTTLKLDKTLDELKGPIKYVSKSPDLCSTIDKGEIPKKGNSQDDLMREIVDLIGDAWKVSLEGQPNVFGNALLPNKKCFTVFLFEVKQLEDLKEGEVLGYRDFREALSLYPYKEFDVNGERVMYSVLDYVQDSPNPESYAGRIDAFTEVDDKDFCNGLSDAECTQKKEGIGFTPKGIYAIAVVSGQGIPSITDPTSKINYVIVNTEAKVRGLCNEAT